MNSYRNKQLCVFMCYYIYIHFPGLFWGGGEVARNNYFPVAITTFNS